MLWNCGVFAFKAKFLLNILADKKLPVNYEELHNSYQSGTMHGIKAISDLLIIEVQTGTNLYEKDIAEVFMSWEEIEEYCKYSDKRNEVVKDG